MCLGDEYDGEVYCEDEIQYDVYSAIDFFDEHKLTDVKPLCAAILKHGRDVVYEHAFAIVIHNDDEDENMRPVYDTPRHVLMATAAMWIVDWSHEDLKDTAEM